VAARRVAKFLGTIHHEFTFTVEEGLDALEDLIWHLESVEQARGPVAGSSLARLTAALGVSYSALGAAQRARQRQAPHACHIRSTDEHGSLSSRPHVSVSRLCLQIGVAC